MLSILGSDSISGSTGSSAFSILSGKTSDSSGAERSWSSFRGETTDSGSGMRSIFGSKGAASSGSLHSSVSVMRSIFVSNGVALFGCTSPGSTTGSGNASVKLGSVDSGDPTIGISSGSCTVAAGIGVISVGSFGFSAIS